MDSRERDAKTHILQGDRLLSTSPAQALKEYTSAIEIYLTLASSTNLPPSTRTRCRSACEALITKAEALKRRQSQSTSVKPVVSTTPVPVTAEEKLSVREETILLKSSKINGGKYPPFKSLPALADEDTQFTYIHPPWTLRVCVAGGEADMKRDPFGFLALSKCQERCLGSWLRPQQFLSDPSFEDRDGGGMYLVQDVITDCSLVASLCASSAWEFKHQHSLVTDKIFPRGVSKSGKYIVQLHLNGCLRTVIIDDLLPQSRSGKPLHVVSQTAPDLIYPALIEKAFLKVMGGYDFPGSNSSTDLHILTGWIPEVIHLQEDEVDLDQVWERVFRAWREGNVLATVGTGSLSPREESEFGLVGDHNYSIFDILDRRGGRRVLQVRNPWSKGGIPHTAFSLGGLHDAISDTPTDLHDDPSKGTFWIDYTTLTRLFKTLYLNWNPRLFTHVKRKHFQFTPTGSDFDVGVNGQYTLTVNGTAETWILLERHYLGKSEGWEGYIGLAVFPGNERIYSYSRPLFRTEYVDGNHTLLKLSNLQANTQHTILIIANDKNSPPPQPQRFFTLTVYSSFPLTLSDPVDALPHEVRVRGTWKRGISYKSPQSTFVENPQYKLVVPAVANIPSAKITALLESADQETAVNVTIAWSAGKRLARLANQDILCQSGEYIPHHAKTSSRAVKLSTQYTVIASRFQDLSPHDPTFTLILRSSVPVTLTPLREEWAGKSRKQISSHWHPHRPSKDFILSVARLTSFSVRLSVPATAGPAPFVRLSLRTYVPEDDEEGAEQQEEGEEGEELVASGEGFRDLGVGEVCAIEGFDLVGGEEYLLCVERLGEEEGEFVLDFLADGELEPIEI